MSLPSTPPDLDATFHTRAPWVQVRPASGIPRPLGESDTQGGEPP
jgi:hypothetical protein